MDKDVETTGNAATRPAVGRRFARNLDWNLLRVFHEIVLADGISGAANRLNRKQPALSMALKRLEDHVGARLCYRGPGGFVLTPEGENLAKIAAEIYGAISGVPNSIADVATDVRGRVRIQVISNLVDPRIDSTISDFHYAHDKVEIFVSVTTWDVIQRSVLRNEVEIGIAPATHQLPDLDYEVLFREVYKPYVGPAHSLFGKRVENPAELRAYPFVLTGADEPDQQTRFRQKYGLGRHVGGLSEHLEEARRLTVLGVGICFLPEAFAQRDVNDGLLHPVLDFDDYPSSNVYMITNPKAPPHRARDRLLEFARSRG